MISCGCAATASEPLLPNPDSDMGLGDVVMLHWTTRAPEGLLGHVMERDVIRLDPHRRVVDGVPRFVPNAQRIKVILSVDQTAEVGAGMGPVSAKVSGERTTHVAYDVTVTGYLELAPDQLHYAKESGCCLGGGISPSCGDWYVVRLMRGTGRAQYLQRLAANAQVDGLEIVKARGGSVFQRVNEISFEDAYFAYEVVGLAGLCSRVPPDEEIEALAVSAPHNCWAHALQADGTRITRSWYMQSVDLCTSVAQNHCKAVGAPTDCQVTFDAQSASGSDGPPTE